MSTDEKEHRKDQLDHLVDERFADVYFLAKEEYDIESNSSAEKNLYLMLDEFKQELRRFCELHKMDSIIRKNSK